jgi:hypothetical protein
MPLTALRLLEVQHLWKPIRRTIASCCIRVAFSGVTPILNVTPGHLKATSTELLNLRSLGVLHIYPESTGRMPEKGAPTGNN